MKGYRVWKIPVPKNVQGAIEEFMKEYRLRAKLCSLCGKCKKRPKRFSECSLGVLRGTAFYYVFEAARVFEENLIKWWPWRPPPRPPVLAWVEFYERGQRLYGSRGAPLRVDLSSGTVRLVVGREVAKWEVKPRKLRSLREEVLRAREHGIKFITLIPSHLKYIVITAFREARSQLGTGVLVVALDLNSHYGTAIVIASASADGVKVHAMIRMKPPNHGGRRRVAARLQHLATSLKVSIPLEKRKEYFEEARRVRRREKLLNEAFINSIVALARRWVRWANEKGFMPIIIVDKPDPQSLQGTPLQCTLLRVCKKLENLAAYEGALYWEIRVSGRRCPLCGAKGVKDRENGRRYRCEGCGVTFDRDFSASHRLVLKAFLAFANPEAIKEYKRILKKPGMLGA